MKKIQKDMPDELRGGDEHKSWDAMDKYMVKKMKFILNLSLFG
jgi:hypothetical protein